ncbi:secreted RxLR effector protein 161-like [Photinus pyralis]|uniref:secreted RxLR effector protein 161-like n=1 Tax=Photinus pyralis TaxID=7054 RepID=UPI0012673355|nr:secreted RxLR effector protein 161-like [Photinus pyralis]
MIGCLMYAMLTTRPDISAAVNFYSRFQNHATEEQWNGLKKILRYIQQTKDIGLFFPKQQSEALVGYADSDWGGNTDRKSISGYMFQVLGSTVSWTTKKQATVALSSTEAEYVALASAGTELIWPRGLLKDLGIDCLQPITVYEDNQACIHLLQRWQHNRLKHVDVNYNFITCHVTYICTTVADILTKGLSRRQFENLRQKLGLQR